jgi:hypothetical protein
VKRPFFSYRHALFIMKISAVSSTILALAISRCDAYSIPTRSSLRSLGQTKSVQSVPSQQLNEGSSSLKMEGKVCSVYLFYVSYHLLFNYHSYQSIKVTKIVRSLEYFRPSPLISWYTNLEQILVF